MSLPYGYPTTLNHQKPDSRERSGTGFRAEAEICGRTSDEGTSDGRAQGATHKGASCGRTPGKRAPDGRAQGAPDRNGPGCQETGGQKATVETEKEKKSYDQDHIVGRSYSSSSGGRVFMEEIQPVERAGEPAGILWNPTRRTAGCYCQRPDHGAPGNDIRRESLSAV